MLKVIIGRNQFIKNIRVSISFPNCNHLKLSDYIVGPFLCYYDEKMLF